jgi:hypothetical protein
VIQRDTKLSRSPATFSRNRHGLPILDPPRSPRPVDLSTAEREAKLRATERYYDERIKQQISRPPYKPRSVATDSLRRF